jgi:hypothetical protein
MALNDSKMAIPGVSCSSLLEEDWSADVTISHYRNSRIVGPQSRMVRGPQLVPFCTDGPHAVPVATFIPLIGTQRVADAG